MLRKLTEAKKKFIAGRQKYMCANQPLSKLKYLEDYECPLWSSNNGKFGNFDESGYEIDHIIEHSITTNDCENNLQALCKSCHSVKTKKFLMGMKKIPKFSKNEEKSKQKHKKDNVNEGLSYREMQSICKKNKIRSNIKKEELITIFDNLKNGKEIDKKYLKSSHPNYNNSLFNNIINNFMNLFK